ncbi:MAG: ATP-binding protein [Chitinophagales bacterium]
MNSKEKIRKKLQIILEEDPDNVDRIIQLSSQLASLDKNNVRFSVDAGVIDRLGRELVARQETAVSELVKNSYDADAILVKLTFYNSDTIGGRLKIDDDGLGMTRDQLANGFMRISSTDKIHNPTSERYKRQRAGQKGIGRFAVQRLGEKLTIITQTLNGDKALKLSINWDDYKGDINLNSISNSLEEVNKQREEGTTLIIDGLRDRWSKAAIRRIYRYVSDILQPFPLFKGKKSKPNSKIVSILEEPGFNVKFFKTETGKKIETIADNQSMIYDYALATISGYIDDKGLGIYSIESKKLEIDEIGEIGNDPDDNQIPFNELNNIQFIAYYFVYNSGYIPKMQEGSIKKLAHTKGGIRLYRNGFRVLPYAEPGNDWLKLDESVKRRSILPVHGNQNFFGFVDISDDSNIFNETSSREGLVNNESLIQLQNFIYRTLITGIIKVAQVRKVKLTTNQKKNDKNEWDYESIEVRIKNIAFTLDKLDEELEKEEGSIQAKKKRKKKIKEIKKKVDELQEIQKSEQEKYIKEKSMLRVLSSVGLSIAQFIHEIKYYMKNISHDIKFLIQHLKDNKILLDRALIIEKNFASFHIYTSYFDTVVSQNVVRDLIPIEIRNVVRPFVNSIKNDAEKAGIQIKDPVFNGYLLYLKPMHPSEWSSILFNFYTNSKKAIKRTNRQGEILIECGIEEDKIYLEFSDNGDGIPKDIEDKIFDEFFTTTSAKDFDISLDFTEIAGTGLGLKIVKDIISSYRGSIKVVSPKENYYTCIRVEINKATNKELQKYGL